MTSCGEIAGRVLPSNLVALTFFEPKDIRGWILKIKSDTGTQKEAQKKRNNCARTGKISNRCGANSVTNKTGDGEGGRRGREGAGVKARWFRRSTVEKKNVVALLLTFWPFGDPLSSRC